MTTQRSVFIARLLAALMLVLCLAPVAEARWYNASTGSWMSRDPIGYRGGRNLYQYTKGLAIVLVDPAGLIAESTTRSAYSGCSSGCSTAGLSRTVVSSDSLLLDPCIAASLDYAGCISCCSVYAGSSSDCYEKCKNMRNPAIPEWPSKKRNPRGEEIACQIACNREIDEKGVRKALGVNTCYQNKPIACLCTDTPLLTLPKVTPTADFRKQLDWCIGLQEVDIRDNALGDCTNVPDGGDPVYPSDIPNSTPQEKCAHARAKCNALTAAIACIQAIQCPGGIGVEATSCTAYKFQYTQRAEAGAKGWCDAAKVHCKGQE